MFRGENLKQEVMKEVWKRCGKKLRRGEVKEPTDSLGG